MVFKIIRKAAPKKSMTVLRMHRHSFPWKGLHLEGTELPNRAGRVPVGPMWELGFVVKKTMTAAASFSYIQAGQPADGRSEGRGLCY